MSDKVHLHNHHDHVHDNRSESTTSRSERSRENTPSTLSSHSLDTAPLDRTTSSASTSITNGEGSGSSLGQASQETQSDASVERFLQKIDMEKVSLGRLEPLEKTIRRDTVVVARRSWTDLEQKMQALQQRLELASVKASNGWTDMTINEIEKVRCVVGLDSTTLTRK